MKGRCVFSIQRQFISLLMATLGKSRTWTKTVKITPTSSCLWTKTYQNRLLDKLRKAACNNINKYTYMYASWVVVSFYFWIIYIYCFFGLGFFPCWNSTGWWVFPCKPTIRGLTCKFSLSCQWGLPCLGLCSTHDSLVHRSGDPEIRIPKLGWLLKWQ